jgi:hypothetical protein
MIFKMHKKILETNEMTTLNDEIRIFLGLIRLNGTPLGFFCNPKNK